MGLWEFIIHVHEHMYMYDGFSNNLNKGQFCLVLNSTFYIISVKKELNHLLN